MHRRWLRVPALCVLVALCLSFMPVSASAAGLDATRVYTSCSFWSWLNRTIFSGVYDAADALWGLGADYYGGGRNTEYHGGGRSDADVQSAYNSYVTGLDTDLGTHVIGDNGFRIYVTPSLFSDNYRTPNNPLRFTYSVNATHFTLTGYFTYCWIYFNPLVAPVDGIYTRELSISRGVNRPSTEDLRYTVIYRDCAASTVLVSSDSHYYLEGSDKYYDLDFRFSYWVQPHNYNANTFVSGGSASRAPSLISSAFSHSSLSTRYHVGTKDSNGNIDAVFETSFFDEQSKVFSDPASGRNVTITNWSYDYSTRSYALTDGTDNYTLTFGDDYVTTVVPDGNGGTVTTKYYYVVSEPVPTPATTDPTTGLPVPSSDNYQDDPTTTTGFWSKLWKAFKDGLAALIASIISAIFSGILALINGILGLFTGLLSALAGLYQVFLWHISGYQ